MKIPSAFCNAIILAAGVTALATPEPDIEKRVDGLPSEHVVANGVAFGFLPSDGSATSPAYTMAAINSKLGGKASTYGWYSQITSSTYDGSQLLEVLDDVVSSGAVFQPAVMPIIPFSQVTPAVASQVASVLENFTSKGVEVWLRFGHEMNYYVGAGTYSGTPTEFITAWKNIYSAVSSNSLIKMYWSPNIPVSTATQYFPGTSYVDVVGIDCYPTSSPLSSTAFSDCYAEFYDTYSASSSYNIPFAIGETGYGISGNNDQWLSQLVGQDMCDYPNYIAASWFEYDKESDFRIVEGSASILANTQSLLLSNSGTGTEDCSGGGSTTTSSSTPTAPTSSFPRDTCQWGCEGWDCSSSSPCQTAYTCNNGICGDCTWGCNGWDCSSSSPCNADYTCVSGYCHHSGPAT